MRGRSNRTADEAEIDMTPMLDIVFILLIFFIVTAVFVRERAINMTPPPPGPQNQESQSQPVVLIRIDADSLVFVDNKLVDIGAVRANIERLRAENPQKAVIVQAHPDARNGLVVQIVDQARSANVKDVAFVLSAVE